MRMNNPSHSFFSSGAGSCLLGKSSEWEVFIDLVDS
jgi:hypothetical protein